MKPIVLIAALAASLLASAQAFADPMAVPANIAAAVADPGRPKDDTDRDALRHPAEVLAFTGVHVGDSVVDMLPGGGYFTRIFSKAVGPSGHVYALVPQEIVTAFPKAADGVKALAADPAYANVTVLIEPLAHATTPQPVDLVWTAQNYHDLHNPFGGVTPDLAAINATVRGMLKSGGVYLVLDHAAQSGSGLRDTNTLHRIDSESVKAEVTATGFALDGSSDLLRNPGDDHTLKVFDPGIRGRTDQFIFKFRKPAN